MRRKSTARCASAARRHLKVGDWAEVRITAAGAYDLDATLTLLCKLASDQSDSQETQAWKSLQTGSLRFITPSRTTAAPCSTARRAASRSPTSRATATWCRAWKRRSRASRRRHTIAVSIAPADGYGVRDEALIQRVPQRALQGSGEIRKGMQFQARTDGRHAHVHGDGDRRRHGDARRQPSARRQDAAFRRRGRRACARPPARSSSTATCTAPAATTTRRRGVGAAPAAAAPLDVLEQRQALGLRVRLHRGAQGRVFATPAS